MVLVERATIEAGEEVRLQVPEVLIEAGANIVVKAESVQVIAIRRPVPLRLGGCISFYRPRRKQITSVPHCSSYV
jgi:hypothetical protein